MQLQLIQQKIYELRGQKVLLDFDLDELYEVETRILNQAVKRNSNRFPEDFMFRLTKEESEAMSSQFVMTSPNKRLKSALPFAFTEHGVTMLASILKSERAVQMNIVIVRAFIALQKLVIQYSDILDKINAVSNRVSEHDV